MDKKINKIVVPAIIAAMVLGMGNVAMAAPAPRGNAGKPVVVKQVKTVKTTTVVHNTQAPRKGGHATGRVENHGAPRHAGHHHEPPRPHQKHHKHNIWCWLCGC